MCIPFENLQPVTHKARQSVNHLKILALCELAIALIKFILFQDIIGGFYELISCLILWLCWAQLSYCYCLIYVIYICIFGSISYAANFLTSIIFFIYYIIAVYFVFHAYREFKAQQYEVGGTGNGFFNASSSGRVQAGGGAQYSSGERLNQNYGANQNYGEQRNNDTEAYLPPNQTSQQNSGNQQYFQGKGVRIG